VARPGVAGPSVAGPSVAGPSVAGPGAAGPCVACPSVAGPGAAGPRVAAPLVCTGLPVDEAVDERLEIAESVEFRDAGTHLLGIQGLAHERRHLRHDGSFVALRLPVDTNELYGGQAGLARRAPRQVPAVS